MAHPPSEGDGGGEDDNGDGGGEGAGGGEGEGEIEGDGAYPMALSTRAIGMRSPSSPSVAIATHDPE